MSESDSFLCPTGACYFEKSDLQEIGDIYYVGEVTKGDFVGWHIFCWTDEVKYVYTKLDPNRIMDGEPACGWRVCPTHAPLVMYNVTYRIEYSIPS